MKKTSRTSASLSVAEPSTGGRVEELTEAVTTLTEHVVVLCDVIADLREDVNWITRNGIPGVRPIEHTRVVRMARDPLAPDARDHMELRTYILETHGSPITPEVFDELVSEIAEAMTVVGQEQLNMFLTVLDDARTKLMAAIKNPNGTCMTDEAIAAGPVTQPIPPTLVDALPSNQPGRLF